MRGTLRYEQAIRVVPCRMVIGQSGGVVMAQQEALAYLIMAQVRPDRRSERREQGSLRPRERRLLFPRGEVPTRQGDHLYFGEDDRCWRCMQRRDYPEHTELEAEVEG
ncbi:MAG: hypothetical protein GX674_07445 [Clostridiales bacterium]|nr:hypothetical protein [Clostridiales bacterium]